MNIIQLRNSPLFMGILIVKIVLLACCSSDYLLLFFKPFISHFLGHFDNPWNYFYQQPASIVEFPYHPLMLYMLSFFYFPIHFFGITNTVLQVIFLKIPILLADLIIFLLMYRLYPTKKNLIIVSYFASPIVLYAAYLHSQLDLIPTMFLLLAIYLMRQEKYTWAAISLGLGLSTKLHLAAALPIILIYLFKNSSKKQAVLFFLTTLFTYLLISSPYLFSTGFFHLVLQHPKQMLLFDVFTMVGPFKIYIPIFALMIFYGRFIGYAKINHDLMDAFLSMTFLTLIIFIPPAPAWYIWILPFLTILLIKYHTQHPSFVLLYAALNSAYSVFFIFFYRYPVQGLYFLHYPITLTIPHNSLCNVSFTILEAIACLLLYQLYKIGIRSNKIYNKNQSLVIGISGDSGAGKSTIMNDLQQMLGKKSTLLEGDGDHRWERGDNNWKTFTHLDPKANYLHQQADTIAALKVGKPIYRVDYNHHTGKFDPARRIMSNDFIVLSGLHTFYLPKMRKTIDVKMYIEPHKNLQKHWKIIRDVKERGHSKEHILQQIEHRQHDTQKYIDPQKKFADIIISYQPINEFTIGDPISIPQVMLDITLDSSIKLEQLVFTLMQENITASWNYVEDLQKQLLTLQQAPSQKLVRRLLEENLINKEELISPSYNLLDGYRGFTQLIVLLVMSEKCKDRSREYI